MEGFSKIIENIKAFENFLQIVCWFTFATVVMVFIYYYISEKN